MSGLLIFIVIAAVMAAVVVFYFNKIVQLKVRVSEGWSDIQVQLKRRHDLIGNLVQSVKGYAKHEQETLKKVTEARTMAKQAEGGSIEQVQSAERQLSSALGGLKINALSEAYPDLKANENFLQLQAELSDTENKIASSRRFYNTTVLSLNTAIQQFPGMLFAGMAGASAQKFFELDEDGKAEVQNAPTIDFGAAQQVEKQVEVKQSPAPEAKEEATKSEVKVEEAKSEVKVEEVKEGEEQSEVKNEEVKSEVKPVEEVKEDINSVVRDPIIDSEAQTRGEPKVELPKREEEAKDEEKPAEGEKRGGE